MSKIWLRPTQTREDQQYYAIHHGSINGSVFIKTWITRREARKCEKEHNLVCELIK